VNRADRRTRRRFNMRPDQQPTEKKPGETRVASRPDVRITVCSACSTYGLISTDTGRCTCEHNHEDAVRDYGCRMSACGRRAARIEERADEQDERVAA
jgi:hypothetical protein